MCGCCNPKQCFIAMVSDYKSQVIILWCVISMKFNIGKKIIGLEIMTLNCEKIQHISKLIELMFKEELHCLQG